MTSSVTGTQQPLVVLLHALDQAGDVIEHVRREQFGRATPCAGWKVRELLGHLLAVPATLQAMMRGEQADLSAPPPDPGETGWAARFRAASDDLVHAWHQREEVAATDTGAVDLQIAEVALHTWDLARATGQRPTLDPQVADRALAFLQQQLTEDNRAPTFGPAIAGPDDAPPYERLAAFAGRDPAA